MSKTIILCLFFLSFSNLYAQNKMVYGEDNRVEVSEAEPRYAQLAKSTAAMIKKTRIFQKSDTVKFTAPTLEEKGVCLTERFSGQMGAAVCSGFLVGEDLLVTAGHCIRSSADCAKFAWVFDYTSSTETLTSIELPKSSVYSCKKIVARKLTSFNRNDYALIQLDRPVTGRSPLKYRKWGRVKVGTKLVVIGHPSGLPTKVAAGGVVRSRKSKYFVTNLDTFGGNSGSAVFNAETGVVEGILVRGDTDYIQSRTHGCKIVKRCSNNACRGEDATFIRNVPKI